MTTVQVYEGDGIPFTPGTVEDAVDRVILLIKKEDLDYIRTTSAAGLHSDLGRFIRNTLSLWNGNNDLRKDAEQFFKGEKVMPNCEYVLGNTVIGVTHLEDGLLHPDCVSHIIIEQLQLRLGKP